MDILDKLNEKYQSVDDRYYYDHLTKIINLIDQSGMSRSDLAKRYGCSLPFLTKLLSGQYNPSLRTLAKLEEVLGKQFIFIGTQSTTRIIELSKSSSLQNSKLRIEHKTEYKSAKVAR